MKEFQLCDSRRLRKKPQDAQDDVTELFDLFDAYFWGWKGIQKIDFMTPADSVRGLEMQNFGFTTVLFDVFSCGVLPESGGRAESFFFGRRQSAFAWSPHLRLTCGPAGNRTATGSLSATSRTSPYQLLHRDACSNREHECIHRPDQT